MQTATSVLELIGNTPLLRLGEIEPPGGGEIWAKLETANPGGSIKDRIGLEMVRAAEAAGTLAAGGTIVEATAGNTGIGLALAGVRLGYRVVLVVPEKYAIEKQRLMAALGAEVVVTPSDGGMALAQARAREITAATPGAAYVNQFANPANPDAHSASTGPEILAQMDGRIDAVVIGCGSGGTFSGVARFLKGRRPGLLAVAVEPEGSVIGGGAPGPHLVEGIGMDEVHATLDRLLIDEVITVPDAQAFAMVRRLARECGVFAGSSGGANVHAATTIAARLGAGARVATVIPDSCERYLSKDIFALFPEEA